MEVVWSGVTSICIQVCRAQGRVTLTELDVVLGPRVGAKDGVFFSGNNGAHLLLIR